MNVNSFELIESQGVGQIQPDWAMEEAFEFDLRQSSLKVTHKKAKTDVKWENRTIQVDALEASHPVSVTVNDPKEINSLFDHAISYNKV